MNKLRSPITEQGIAHARRQGHLKKYLVNRIAGPDKVPQGWLSEEEIELARYTAEQEALPLIERDGKFGTSKNGNPTFSVGNYTLWWVKRVTQPANCTAREFLAWADKHGLKIEGRQLLEPVPADAAPRYKSLLERVIGEPTNNLRFADFVALKVEGGRDQLSNYSKVKLTTMVSVTDLQSVEEAFEEDQHQGRCLRWILRGLSCEKATRKVKADLQVSRQAAQANIEEDTDDKWYRLSRQLADG